MASALLLLLHGVTLARSAQAAAVRGEDGDAAPARRRVTSAPASPPPPSSSPSLPPPPAPPACTVEAQATCASATEPCVLDPRCLGPGAPVGCNAAGYAQCRFCGFAHFDPCPGAEVSYAST